MLRAIVASTQNNIQFDAERASFLYSEDAIKEVHKQLASPINHIALLLQAPTSRVDFNQSIGEVTGSSILIEDGQMKVRADIGIYDPKIESMIDKQEMAVYTILGTGNHSVRNQITTDSKGNSIKYLLPPLTVLALNLGPMRSSSNVYLRII